MELRIKRLNPAAITPTRAKPGDSGLDLYACLPDGPVFIMGGDHSVVPTGVAVELPEGHEGQVRPRSGLAARNGIAACLGTIDNGYRGEVGVNLFNMSFGSYRVNHGDRIAQLVVAPVALPEVLEVDELSETERGAGGFGHSGV